MRLTALHLATPLLALLLWSSGRPPLGAASSPSALIAVDMDRATSGVQTSLVRARGDGEVSVDIVVSDANAVGAFDVELALSAPTLTFGTWSEGSFLGSTGRNTGCQTLITEHSFRLGCSTVGPTPAGPSGSGLLATVNLHDVYTSKTCLVVTLAETSTVAGEPLPTVGQTGCLTMLPDADGDGVQDSADNCPQIANADQRNTDAANAAAGVPGADSLGDVCDADIDGDGYSNASEVALGKNPATYCGIMRADVDGDGSISIFDLALLGERFLSDVPPAPERYKQDGDQAIGILDLAAVAEFFLQSVSACP